MVLWALFSVASSVDSGGGGGGCEDDVVGTMDEDMGRVDGHSWAEDEV